MSIQNRIIEIVNEYDYEDEVANLVNLYENNPWQEGHIMDLTPHIDSEFEGDEEEIAQKVAQQVINFRVIEKTFMKLMSKGILHPVGISDGRFNQPITYRIQSSMTRRITTTTLYFPRSIFTSFMKV